MFSGAVVSLVIVLYHNRLWHLLLSYTLKVSFSVALSVCELYNPEIHCRTLCQNGDSLTPYCSLHSLVHKLCCQIHIKSYWKWSVSRRIHTVIKNCSMTVKWIEWNIYFNFTVTCRKIWDIPYPQKGYLTPQVKNCYIITWHIM